jgi:hypothetical protein
LNHCEQSQGCSAQVERARQSDGHLFDQLVAGPCGREGTDCDVFDRLRCGLFGGHSTRLPRPVRAESFVPCVVRIIEERRFRRCRRSRARTASAQDTTGWNLNPWPIYSHIQRGSGVDVAPAGETAVRNGVSWVLVAHDRQGVHHGRQGRVGRA